MQKSKTTKPASTPATTAKTRKTRKKPGPKSKLPKIVKHAEQVNADNQKQKENACIARNHNLTKMIITGFKAQIERIIYTDELLGKITINDLKALHVVVSSILARWEMEKGKNSDGMEQTERNDLYG